MSRPNRNHTSLREMQQKADTGDCAIALAGLSRALRAVEKRGREFDGAAVVIHADGSGRVTAGDDERILFEFDYARHLARWISATDAERTVIEKARAAELAEREASAAAEFVEYEASLRSGAAH